MALVEQEHKEKNLIEFRPDQIELLKKTVAKGATNDEFEMFMYLAKRYGLDPFLKEIHFSKYKSKKTGEETVSFIVARDGYLKIAQANPEYDGLISFTVREGDTFEIDASHYEITHKFGVKRGKLLGAWARCDRKDKRPQICFVEFEEYKGSSGIWESYPSAMIQKVAEVFVLRRQFNITGLVAREEIDYSEDGANLNYSKNQPESKQIPAKAASKPAESKPTESKPAEDPGKTQIIPKSETTQAKQNMIEGEFHEEKPKEEGIPYSDQDFDENIENLLNLAVDDAAMEMGFSFNKWFTGLKVKDEGTKAEMRLLPTKIGATEKAFKFSVNGNVFFAPRTQCVESAEGIWVAAWLLKKKQEDIEKSS